MEVSNFRILLDGNGYIDLSLILFALNISIAQLAPCNVVFFSVVTSQFSGQILSALV